MITMNYIYLDYIRNANFILAHYKFDGIMASLRRTLLKFCAFKFFNQAGIFTLSTVYIFKFQGELSLRQSFDVVYL